MPGIAAGDADQVAAAVGDLPLAVDQAGALLADTGMRVDAYMRLVTERAGQVLGRGRGDGSTASAAASWMVAFDRLASDDPAALQILTALAWLAPEPVPVSLLGQHPDRLPALAASAAADELTLADRITALRRRGLIRVASGHVVLHRVPAALLRARTADDDGAGGGWAATVARLLRHAVPRIVWDAPTAWPTWHALLPHALAVVDERRNLGAVASEVSWLLRRTGQYIHTRGRPAAARPFYERAHAMNLGRLDPDDPAVLGDATNLANVLGDLGEHRQARALDEDTFERRRRTLGPDHADTLISTHNLAVRLSALGEHEHARALAEDTLDRCRHVFGEDHRTTLMAAINLAGEQASLGDDEHAAHLLEDTLQRCRRALGEDDVTTLDAEHRLAVQLSARGEHKRARELTQRTVAARRRVLGDDHPDTLVSFEHLVHYTALAEMT